MKNACIFTPYFTDEPCPALAEVREPEATLNPARPEGDEQMARLASLHKPIADFTETAARASQRPVSVAGDCCAAIPVLAGLQRAGLEPTVIWLDAHGDFNTHATTPSGFLGGMPLAMMVGRGDRYMCEAVGLKAHPESKVVLADGRDLDPEEADALAGSEVRLMGDLEDLLVNPLPEGPLYVHLDADIIDSETAPAHRYPAPGGPGPDLLGAVAKKLADSGQIVAVSLSAWHLEADLDGATGNLIWPVFQDLTAF